MQFIGRDQQLGELRALLDGVRDSGRGAIATVSGRRRVGTTALVERFAADSGAPLVHFTAGQARDHRQELSRLAGLLAGSDLPCAAGLRHGLAPDSWEELLALAGGGLERPAIIVLDEFPWLAETDKSVLAGIRAAWDRALEGVPVLLLLAGPDAGLMSALGRPKGPLAQRVIADVVVPQLTPAEVGDLLGLGPQDAVDAYLITGGLPQLVAAWPKGSGRKGFLSAQLEDAQSPLVVSGERAMAAEAPMHTSARAVLQAIGTGETTFNRISEQASLGASRLSAVIKTLEEQGAVEVRIPYRGDDGSKAKRYLVADPYLRFWMAFVEPAIGELERGRSRPVRERIEHDWALYRAAAVEPVVRGALQRMLPDPRLGGAEVVGGWWTRDQRVRVDLVGWSGEGKDSHPAFIGAIAWGDRGPFGRSDEQLLREQRELVPDAGPALPLVAVSRSGFRRGVEVDLALGPDELIDAWR